MEIKTLEDVKKERLFGSTDFSNVINDSLDAIEQNKDKFDREMDITDIPISPMCIEDDVTPIVFYPEVMEKYKELVSLINKPETALEYMYVLLGKKVKAGDDEIYIVDKIVNCNTDKLSSREVEIDQDKLNEAVSYGVKNGYNFISLCHTHPKVADDIVKSSVASYLDENTKRCEFIRDVGLNLSLQDFISYEALYRYFSYNSNVRTSLTVIMYNGEIAMVSKQNAELRRFTFLMDSEGEPIYVSSKEEYLNKLKI